MQGALAQRARERISKPMEDSLLDIAMPDMVDTPVDAVLHKSGRFHRARKVKVRFNRQCYILWQLLVYMRYTLDIHCVEAWLRSRWVSFI